jgi:hypothetical protein
MQFAASAAPARSRRHVGRASRILLACEAAAFAVAAAVHFGTGFTQAAVAETIIAAVLGAAVSATRWSRAGERKMAVGATGFAIFGTIVGLTIIATGRQAVPDLTFHASILAVLLASMYVLARPNGR